MAVVGRMDDHGALPVPIAVEKMVELGLLTMQKHGPQPHGHKRVINPCHDAIRQQQHVLPDDGEFVVEFTPRGRDMAQSIIRRHRLSERLFVESFHMQSQEEIEEQACKFEHILSPEATEKICTFLGHPRTCPHGAPIPPGPCCGAARLVEYERTEQKVRS